MSKLPHNQSSSAATHANGKDDELYDKVLDILIEEIEAGRIEIGGTNSQGKVGKSISNDTTIRLVNFIHSEKQKSELEGRIREVGTAIKLYANSPGIDSEVILKDLNRRLKALKETKGEE